MYRGASTLRWFELPGIVSAYQPVAAPDPIAARQNMGLGLLGRYTATPGVAPTWAERTGWTFNGDTSKRYLLTNIVNGSGWSMICRYTNVTSTDDSLCGSYGGSTTLRFILAPNHSDGKVYYQNGLYLGVAPALTSGVLGVSGQQGYRNGVADGGTIGAWSGTNATQIAIGAQQNSQVLFQTDHISANIQAIAVFSRTLIPSEMFTTSRQMAYCDTVPEFNAWARQRFYMYLPIPAIRWPVVNPGIVGGHPLSSVGRGKP